MHIRANVGACLSLKGELAQEHLRITYMQIIETTASLSKAVLLYRLYSFTWADFFSSP